MRSINVSYGKTGLERRGNDQHGMTIYTYRYSLNAVTIGII